MKYLLLLASVMFIMFQAKATHIIGGSLTYEHLGGSSYNVKLKLYRDCGPGNVAFPNSVTITVRQGNGNTTGLNFTMPRLGIIELDPPIDSCAVDPGICVEEAVEILLWVLPLCTIIVGAFIVCGHAEFILPNREGGVFFLGHVSISVSRRLGNR